MFKKIYFSLFFICLLTVSLRASWQESGPQYATHAIDISVSLDSRDSLVIFVADSTYRLYKSDNVDSGWTDIIHPKSHNPSCVLQISDTDTIYLGRYMGINPDSAGVFRSMDNGDNWDRISTSINNGSVTTLAYSSVDPTYMFAGCDTFKDASNYRPVFHWSSNGGIHWWPIPDDTPPGKATTRSVVFDIIFMPGNTTKGYGAAGRTFDYPNYPDWGIWRVSWSEVISHKFSGDARALALGNWSSTVKTLYAGIYSGDSAGVWVTADSGVTWDSLSGTLGYPITTIALDPTSIEDTLLSNDTLYVGTDGYGIMRSTNGGSSWSFVNSGIYCKNILDIKVDPVNNNRVYAGGAWSFYVSTDSGQTWTERIQGMKRAEISGVASNAPTQYCIGEFDNLYKSADSSNNWLTIYAFEGKPGFQGSDRIKAKLLTVNKDNTNKLVATLFVPSSEDGHNSDRILRSTDGGLSWHVVFDPSDSGLIATSLVIDPQDSNKIYATYDDPTNTKMVMKSTSGGDSASWSAKVSGLPNDGVLCLIVDPANHNTLYVGTKANGVYKNVGGGDSSWTQTGLTDKEVRCIGINAENVKELYAGTSVGVYRSGDTGASWSLSDNGMTHKDVYSLAIELDLSPEIYAACLDSNSNGHLYKSTNSGTNWSSADSGLPSDWVVFADDVPYISLQTDTLSSVSYVFLGTNKGLFKQEMPSYSYFSGYINQDTTWGPGTLYLNGDVTVASQVVLTIDSGTSILIKPNFDSQEGGSDAQKCELIVNGSLSARGSLNDSIKFISSVYAPSDSDWYGIKIGSGGSARLNYCNFRNAYTAIYFANSTHDSVTHCRFRNNFMHAIKTQNSNLVIDSCVIENDSLGGSDETYGILCYSSSPTITNTLIKRCKYAIKCDGPFFAPSSPLIEECGFYDIGETGIWCGIGSHASIKNSCFKGDFGKTCIQVDISGSPLIRKCYMASEGSGIPIGMLFLNGATGNVRRSTIWDYDSCAVQIASPSNPDFGTSDSVGNNWFERNDHYYFRSSSYCTIKAESNNWETNDSAAILSKISGNVDFSPFLDYCTPPIPYYPDICSNLPPDDPTISPCKIAVTSDEKIPKSFSVSQNYPNPFNPSTVIKYDLPEPEHVRITIYNILGQKVRTVVDEDQEAGYKSVNWDGKDDQGKDVSTGIYFYQIKAGDFSTVKKMVLLK